MDKNSLNLYTKTWNCQNNIQPYGDKNAELRHGKTKLS